MLVVSIVIGAPAPTQAQTQNSKKYVPRHQGRDTRLESLHLNLTTAQRPKLQKLITDSRTRTMSVRRDLRRGYTELFTQLGNYNPDAKHIHETVRRINTAQLNLLNTHLESQMGLRKILTKDQFQNLRETIPDTINGEIRTKPRSNGVNGPKMGDVKQLGLSSDQQEKIKRLFQSSSERMKSAVQRVQNGSNSLRQLYLDYDLNVQQAKSRITGLNRAQQDVLKVTISRQEDLRKILTQQQFETLSKSVRRHFSHSDQSRFRGKKTEK
jgi:Spy/CpxP family protein refolding chaperone